MALHPDPLAFTRHASSRPDSAFLKPTREPRLLNDNRTQFTDMLAQTPVESVSGKRHRWLRESMVTEPGTFLEPSHRTVVSSSVKAGCDPQVVERFLPQSREELTAHPVARIASRLVDGHRNKRAPQTCRERKARESASDDCDGTGH